MENNKQLENLTASVITSQILLHYLEELKHTRYYKGKVKESVRAAVIQLMKVERNEFDKAEEVDQELTHQVSTNLMAIIGLLLRGGFSNMILLGNMQYAHHLNPKAIEGIVRKVIEKEGDD